MRKMLLLLLLSSLFLSAFAELHKPNRIIEYGVESTVGVSNNYFKPSDILTKNIVLDLQKIADELPDEGLTFDVFGGFRTFLNFNIVEQFRLGFFVGLEGNGYLNIGKDLFDFLGSGYAVGQCVTFESSGYGDIWAEAGISFHTKLFDTYGITIAPAYVIPIAYIKKVRAQATVATTASGAIRGEAHAPVSIYTVVDAQKFVENDFTKEDITDAISEAASQGGVDISFEIERPVLKRLDVGIFTRIPIVPGRLQYEMIENVYASFTEDNLLDEFLNKSRKSTRRMRYKVEDIVYSKSGTQYVFRPFRLGIEGAWRPFGAWCVFRPKLAFVARGLFTSDIEVYPEYAVDAHLTFLKVLGFNIGTAFENRVFIQRIGFMFNFRVVQIDIKAMVRSASLINSFALSGAGAYVGLRIGF